MRCREAKRLRLAAATGPLAVPRRDALRAHLACCPACAEESRMDGWIERDLAALREELPFDVDVSDRVLRAVATLGPPRDDRPSPWQLGWAAAAAVAAGLVAAAGLGSLVAGRGEALSQAAGLVRALWGTTVALVRPVAALARTVLGALWSVLEWMVQTAGGAGSSQAAAWSLLVGWTLVLTTALLFVGRDLLRGSPLFPGKEF